MHTYLTETNNITIIELIVIYCWDCVCPIEPTAKHNGKGKYSNLLDLIKIAKLLCSLPRSGTRDMNKQTYLPSM